MTEFNKNYYKVTAEARKAEMTEITAKLEQGVKDIFNSDRYKDYLRFCAKLPKYSVNNQILIMLQKPEATMCQSFLSWKNMGRSIKKGEKGIRILAPSPFKVQQEQNKIDEYGSPILDKDGNNIKEIVMITINAFKPVSTFDISQTEGEPIPNIEVNELTSTIEGYETLLNSISEIVSVPITFENISSGAKGYFSLADNRIVIQEGMSEAQTLKTLIHESAHSILHSKTALDSSAEKKSKNQKETEAESVAYIVCQHYGIDTSEYSFQYLATWSKDKEVSELKSSLDIIRETASSLIDKIDNRLKETNLI